MTLIKTAKDRQFLVAVAHHRLVPIYTERPTEPKITYGFKDAGFAAAVFAKQQID